MSYNNLPGIEKAMSCDRYMIHASKFYFAAHEKPPKSSKTYYIDELLSCLKYTL